MSNTVNFRSLRSGARALAPSLARDVPVVPRPRRAKPRGCRVRTFIPDHFTDPVQCARAEQDADPCPNPETWGEPLFTLCGQFHAGADPRVTSACGSGALFMT